MNTQSNQNKFKVTLPYLILVGVIVAILLILNFQGSTVNELTTGELLKNLKDNEVTEIMITPNSNESVYYVEGKLKDYDKNESFKTKLVESEVPLITDYVTKNDIACYD